MVINRQDSLIVYDLTKRFGKKITVTSEVIIDTDLITGKVSHKNINVTVRKAIVLSAQQSIDYIYDLSFVAANKNFTYGGFFDVDSRIVIFESKKVNKKFTLTTKDTIKIKNDIYAIKLIDHDSDAGYYMLTINGTNSNRGV